MEQIDKSKMKMTQSQRDELFSRFRQQLSDILNTSGWFSADEVVDLFNIVLVITNNVPSLMSKNNITDLLLFLSKKGVLKLSNIAELDNKSIIEMWRNCKQGNNINNDFSQSFIKQEFRKNDTNFFSIIDEFEDDLLNETINQQNLAIYEMEQQHKTKRKEKMTNFNKNLSKTVFNNGKKLSDLMNEYINDNHEIIDSDEIDSDDAKELRLFKREQQKELTEFLAKQLAEQQRFISKINSQYNEDLGNGNDIEQTFEEQNNKIESMKDDHKEKIETLKKKRNQQKIELDNKQNEELKNLEKVWNDKTQIIKNKRTEKINNQDLGNILDELNKQDESQISQSQYYNQVKEQPEIQQVKNQKNLNKTFAFDSEYKQQQQEQNLKPVVKQQQMKSSQQQIKPQKLVDQEQKMIEIKQQQQQQQEEQKQNDYIQQGSNLQQLNNSFQQDLNQNQSEYKKQQSRIIQKIASLFPFVNRFKPDCYKKYTSITNKLLELNSSLSGSAALNGLYIFNNLVAAQFDYIAYYFTEKNAELLMAFFNRRMNRPTEDPSGGLLYNAYESFISSIDDEMEKNIFNSFSVIDFVVIFDEMKQNQLQDVERFPFSLYFLSIIIKKTQNQNSEASYLSYNMFANSVCSENGIGTKRIKDLRNLAECVYKRVAQKIEDGVFKNVPSKEKQAIELLHIYSYFAVHYMLLQLAKHLNINIEEELGGGKINQNNMMNEGQQNNIEYVYYDNKEEMEIAIKLSEQSAEEEKEKRRRQKLQSCNELND